jgi:DNA-directed RNA polymerase specialized sigma24 family protein
LANGRSEYRAGPVADRRRIVKAVPQHRAVIRRSYYLGWTTARIADDLHITDDTVKSRLHHAMRALRLTLQEMGATGLDRNGR